MNCKYYLNPFKRAAFFIRPEYPQEDISLIINSEKNKYGEYDFIFFDRIDYRDIEEIKQISDSLPRVSFSFVDKAIFDYKDITSSMINKKNCFKIVSISNFYDDDLNNCEIKGYNKFGFEFWQENNIPMGLHFLFDISTKDDITNLLPDVEKIIDEILIYSPRNDFEKIILFDIWMQKNVQYISGKKSKYGDDIYVCPEIDKDSANEDVIKNHFGRCEDISFTATLVLNNPRMKIKCRMVGATRPDGFNHSWNIVQCEGKEYYCDFTHNITRNPNKVPQTLKAQKYNPQFTLLGLDDAKKKYGCTDVYCNNISQTSYDKEKISKYISYLENEKKISLDFGNKVVMESYIERKD